MRESVEFLRPVKDAWVAGVIEFGGHEADHPETAILHGLSWECDETPVWR